MNEMKLYRILQGTTGRLNHLVVGLYKGEITATEVEKQAKEEIQQVARDLNIKLQ